MNPLSPSINASFSGSVQVGSAAPSDKFQMLPEAAPIAMRSMTMADHELSSLLDKHLSSTSSLVLPETDSIETSRELAEPVKPGSLDEALKSRQALCDAGQLMVDDLVKGLDGNTALLKSRPDDARLGVHRGFSTVFLRSNESLKSDLNAFKQELVRSMHQAKSQVDDFKSSPAGTDKQQRQQIEAIMGGKVKHTGFKSFFKFRFNDFFKARSQLKGIFQAAREGKPFAPPGPPVHLERAMRAHIEGLVKRHARDGLLTSSFISSTLAEHLGSNKSGLN